MDMNTLLSQLCTQRGTSIWHELLSLSSDSPCLEPAATGRLAGQLWLHRHASLFNSALLTRRVCKQALPPPLRRLPAQAFDVAFAHPRTQRTPLQHAVAEWPGWNAAQRRAARPTALALLLHADTPREQQQFWFPYHAADADADSSMDDDDEDDDDEQKTHPQQTCYTANAFEWALLHFEFDLLLALWLAYRHNLFCLSLLAIGDAGALDVLPAPLGFFGATGAFNGNELPVLDVNEHALLHLSTRNAAFFLYFLAIDGNGRRSPQVVGAARLAFQSFVQSLPLSVLQRVLQCELPMSTKPSPANANVLAAGKKDQTFNLLRALLGAGKVEHVRVMEQSFASRAAGDQFHLITQRALSHCSVFKTLACMDTAHAFCFLPTLEFMLRHADAALMPRNDVGRAAHVVRHMAHVGVDAAALTHLLHRFDERERLQLLTLGGDTSLHALAQRNALPSADLNRLVRQQVHACRLALHARVQQTQRKPLPTGIKRRCQG